ncbi:hypothetical protein [Kocuria rosea]|uniref:hypothetical protein n=1 Tax=Kocuria rosea TaxID=1275 RepID=UPI003D3579F6
MTRVEVVRIDGAEVDVEVPDGYAVARAIMIVECEQVGENGELFSKLGWFSSWMSNTVRLGMATRVQQDILREALDVDYGD